MYSLIFVYIKICFSANHETEKKKLQEIMSFGRTLKSGKPYKKTLNDDESSTYEESDETMKESFLRESM